MQIRLEMGPKEFVLATRVPIFLVGETLDIVLAGGETLSGRVVATKDAVYGGSQTPCTRIKIGVTSTDIAKYKTQYLRGATVDRPTQPVDRRGL